jgi:hypothetical protein
VDLALDILTMLVERAGEVVTKRELFARLWPDTIVEDANLKVMPRLCVDPRIVLSNTALPARACSRSGLYVGPEPDRRMLCPANPVTPSP